MSVGESPEGSPRQKEGHSANDRAEGQGKKVLTLAQAEEAWNMVEVEGMGLGIGGPLGDTWDSSATSHQLTYAMEEKGAMTHFCIISKEFVGRYQVLKN